MKKILVIFLLLLTGCAYLPKSKDDESLLLISYQNEDKEESKRDEVFEVSDELQLVLKINQNLMNDRMSYTYTTENEIDLNEVVKMLSFLVPFDIKLTQNKVVEKGVSTYTINIEYTDTRSTEVISYLKNVLESNHVNDMNTSEKIDFAHQFIIDHCEYDDTIISRDENNAPAFQIQGVIFDHKAVCSGYSRCFLMMMRLLNVPCLYVSSDIINHSFNLVYDGQYRFIDVTWDEGDNRYYDLDVNAFFKDGKHELSEKYNSEYFMNFLSYIYHLN